MKLCTDLLEVCLLLSTSQWDAVVDQAHQRAALLGETSKASAHLGQSFLDF